MNDYFDVLYDSVMCKLVGKEWAIFATSVLFEKSKNKSVPADGQRSALSVRKVKLFILSFCIVSSRPTGDDVHVSSGLESASVNLGNGKLKT